MKGFHFVKAAAVSALGLSSAHAVPELKFGDNAELFVTGTASATYDDNIFLSSGKKTGDEILDFVPGLDLPFGSSSELSGDAFAKLSLVEYASNSTQDTTLPDFGFDAKGDEGKSKLDLSASYAELAENNATIRLNNIIVRTDQTNAGIYGETGLTEKTSLGGGIQYANSTYDQLNFVNSSVISVPVDAYYSFSPKTDASVGYEYTNSQQSEGQPNYDTNFLNVGVRGEFTPLLTGQARVGYDIIRFDEQPAPHASRYGDQLGVDGAFTYAATEKSSYSLSISNGYTNTGTGVVVKNLSIGIDGSTEIDPQWKFLPGFAYSRRTYPGGDPVRQDSVWTGSAGLQYVYSTYADLSLTYALDDDTSNTSGTSYSDSRVTLALNLRY
jgi:hypothetical protein